MQRFFKVALIALVLLLSINGTALAEKGTIHFRVSPGAVWVISDADFLFDDSATVKLDGGYEFADGVIVQLFYTYFRLINETPRISDANVSSLGVGMRVLPLEWFEVDTPPVSPWVDLGIGWVRIFAEDEFGFNIGLGVDFIITEFFRMGPFFRYDHVVFESDINDFKMASTGVNFAFGYNPSKHEKSNEPVPKPVKK